MFDSTKTTISCAPPPQDEKGCHPFGEALTQVWTMGLLANRVKVYII